MTIPAGMLTETVKFTSNDGSLTFTRKAALNSFEQEADAPEYRLWGLAVTVRYDSDTKRIKAKDFMEYGGFRYTVEEVRTRRQERLIDVSGGSRRVAS